ncbi:MAG: phosphatidylglycerol lysyltransferase domain-containing protein [Woeseiaceae bacterium]
MSTPMNSHARPGRRDSVLPVEARPVRGETAAEPELAGPLEGLKRLDVDDLPAYRAAVDAGGQCGWKYYFPYLLSLNRQGRRGALYARDEGSACVFVWQIRNSRPRLDVFVAPAPMNVPVLRRCIERANDFNGDSSARVMRIDAKDADAVTVAGLRVRPRKRQYLFSPGAYTDLGGKQLYTIRRNVSQIERLSDVEVMPYTTAHRDDCYALLQQWKEEHRGKHDTLGGVGVSRRAIALAGLVPENILRGEVIFIDGRLAAFAFGGEIRPGLACFFERKCDEAIRGLSYFQLRSFLLKLGDFEYVNDGSDAGRPGLRQFKDSFRPAGMHGEYRARQRR